MSSTIRIIAVLAFVILSSCYQDKQNMTVSERIAIENLIKKVNLEIVQAAEQMDAEKLFSYVLNTDNGALIRGGEILLTREDAFVSYKNGIQGIQKINYKFNQEHITVISLRLPF